jgi:hypothetical protein
MWVRKAGPLMDLGYSPTPIGEKKYVIIRSKVFL